jgi:hypothetical protein
MNQYAKECVIFLDKVEMDRERKNRICGEKTAVEIQDKRERKIKFPFEIHCNIPQRLKYVDFKEKQHTFLLV